MVFLGYKYVLVLDRGYPAAWLVSLLLQRGIHFCMRCDGSEPADKALQLAAELSEQTSWPLTVIIVTDNHDLSASLTKKVEDFLEPLKIDSAIIILRGREDREIIKFIREGSVELMVMGAYGHNRLRELILGSTTSTVIRKSTIPVLLTR